MKCPLLCAAFAVASSLAASAATVVSYTATGDPNGNPDGDDGAGSVNVWSALNGPNGSTTFSFQSNSGSAIGNAWGLASTTSSGTVIDFEHNFAGGSITVGQTVSIDIDPVSVISGGTVGISMRDSSNNNVFELFFVGGQNFWVRNDNAGVGNTSVGFGAVNLALTPTGSGGFDLVLTGLESNGNDSISATLAGSQDVNDIRIFNYQGGNDNNFYSNNLSVVPETSCALLGCLGLLGILRRRR